MARWRAWYVLLSMAPLPVTIQPSQEEPCRDFYRVLDTVPRLALATRSGPLESMWDGEPPAVCELKFETTDSILAGAVVPDFLAHPGSATYNAGWRIVPEIVADGAGSGIYGIQRNNVRCVIRRERPAYIDDDGALRQGDSLSMLIQCSIVGSP